MPLRSQPVPDLFWPSICLQRSSKELVVYSAQIHQVVVVAWPKSNGTRILPHCIRSWLRRHGLFWCCFCPLESGSSASCRIVYCKGGTVKAYCTKFPSKCGFLLNLTNIYGSALLTSEYPHLPTLASGRIPDIDDFVLAFQSNASLLELRPYFEGYCGEHISQYRGMQQKAGVFGHSDNVHHRQRFTMDLESSTLAMYADAVRRQHATSSSAATRIIKKKKPASFSLDPEIGPSATVLSSGPIRPEAQELKAIAKLQRGEGVSQYEYLGLIERCGICNRFFTGGVLRRHIFACPSSEV